MFIKLNALVLLEINKLSLSQHLSCQKFDVMLSLLFHHTMLTELLIWPSRRFLQIYLSDWLDLLFKAFANHCLRSPAFHLLFASLKSKIMTTVFSGISHNDNTASTELTCDKAFLYARRKKRKRKGEKNVNVTWSQCRFHITSKAAWRENVAVQVF